jgi:type II secretory pathway predicted ATPase ExeA
MSIDRLRAHYGFSRMPFGKDLAPGMLHAHGAHAEAVARIQWCITEQAIGVVSGECGAGKTVAARAAVAALDASRHTILYLGTPGVGLRGIYGMIVTALGGTPRFHHAALIPQAQDLLGAESSERGKRVVLIIDEAHLLDAESLEGVRCLSNLGMDQIAPFCLLLLGQPTLRRRLRQGAFAALDQRIGLRYAIAGLSAEETHSYVAHHLALAGRADTLFSDDAIGLIHEVSRGLPRQVNNLAVGSLIAAFAANKAIVDESAARVAVAEIAAE